MVFQSLINRGKQDKTRFCSHPNVNGDDKRRQKYCWCISIVETLVYKQHCSMHLYEWQNMCILPPQYKCYFYDVVSQLAR